jgi:hypothetical protein
LINFVGGTCGAADLTILHKKWAHGWLMGLAWGFFLPLGVVIARFMKGTRPPLWFHLHRICQITGIVLTIAGFGLAMDFGSGLRKFRIGGKSFVLQLSVIGV